MEIDEKSATQLGFAYWKDLERRIGSGKASKREVGFWETFVALRLAPDDVEKEKAKMKHRVWRMVKAALAFGRPNIGNR